MQTFVYYGWYVKSAIWSHVWYRKYPKLRIEKKEGGVKVLFHVVI